MEVNQRLCIMCHDKRWEEMGEFWYCGYLGSAGVDDTVQWQEVLDSLWCGPSLTPPVIIDERAIVLSDLHQTNVCSGKTVKRNTKNDQSGQYIHHKS